jgi:NTP pyrophosphatase (non-canonical NTP hydrolase)
MSRNESYEFFVDEFATRPLEGLLWGLAEEVGEVMGVISKAVYYRGGEWSDEDREKLVKELGDVTFYVTAIAGRFGITTAEIRDVNEKKLRARFPDGPNGRQVR